MSHLLDEVRRKLAILDMQPGASWQQVKDRYRFLAKVWHPDRFGSDLRARSRAEKQFQAVNEAYQWLLQHRSTVESLAESDSGPAEGTEGESGKARGRGEGREPAPERERRSRPVSAPKIEKDTRASTVEKFLWGVAAAFALMAVVFFVASSLPGWLSEREAGSANESERDSSSPSSSAPSTRDAGPSPGSYAMKYVTASRLYVRSGPTRDAPVVSALERGSRVRVRPGSDGPWLPVVADDGREAGWLHSGYLSDTAPASTSSLSIADDRNQPAVVSPEMDFATFVRAQQSGEEQPEGAGSETSEPDAGSETTRGLELIRGAWKPKNPNPFDRDGDGARAPDSGLDRWSGAVEGVAPSDLPRVTVRLYEDVVVGQPIGGAVYWHQAGACTYVLELQEQIGEWMRTEQIAESSECGPQGEIWLFAGESDMTAIWYRPDGSQWFSSRLKMD
jgi:uncharacterized protein YgiM (DUF1202 family)